MTHLARMTPLRVVEDVADESLFYEAFGATRVDKVAEPPESVTYRAANDTGVVLASEAWARRAFGPFVAGKLARFGALYFQVADIDAELADLPGPAHILTRAQHNGVDEAVIETAGGLVVLVASRAVIPA